MSGRQRLLLPNDLTPGDFLAGYWQKQPLFMPGAIGAVEPALSAGELAWLATQTDVESRLVFTEEQSGQTRYRVKHGPFENEVLSSLPRQDWTLLVQDVDKHLPDFRRLFHAVNFIPDWRIDDLMVSFAAPGGSVGPHRDHYDVFLCQGEGTREWHLGDPAAAEPDPSAGDLELVRPFTDPRARRAAAGDVLYLPPGVPHWGIARDFCMTYSIGMRAPSIAELHAGAARLIEDFNDATARSSASGADRFYTDPDLSPTEAMPGQLSVRAVERTQALLPNGMALGSEQAATLLGCVVTDPKAWLDPDGLDDAAAAEANNAALCGRQAVPVHGMAKLAWFDDGKRRILFANGHARSVSAGDLECFAALCRDRAVVGRELCANCSNEVRHWLLVHGVLDISTSD